MPHLVVLLVVLPLLAAPICLLISSRVWVTRWAIAATTGTAILGLLAFSHLLSQGAWTYAIGGWQPPLGIAYRLDFASGLVVLLVAGIAAIVAWWAPPSLSRELTRKQHPYFWASYLLCLAGMLGIAVTADAFNAFVFLEISSLSTYVLIGLGPHRKALLASFRYLILGSIGGTFILIGVGLLYQMTGTLNMADLAQRLPAVRHTRTVLVSFAFITVGTSLKFALWPLHGWLPDAYASAPSAVAAFIASSGTKVMLYLLMRLALTVYGVEFTFGTLALGPALLALGIVGIVVTSVSALHQRDIRKLFAYSSVAQVGYIVLGFGLGTEAGVAAAMAHLLHHGVTKGLVFLAVGTFVYRVSSGELDDLSGLGRVMPWTFFAFVVGGLGLIGIPGTMGFVSKWMLCTALIEAGLWPLVGLVLLTSLLALAYVWRVVEYLWVREPSPMAYASAQASGQMLIPLGLLALLTLVLGVWGQPLSTFAGLASRALLGGV